MSQTQAALRSRPQASVPLLTRLRHIEPATLLWAALVLALLFLVGAPMLKLFIMSFQDQQTGAFTLRNYAAAYGKARNLDALRTSLLLGASAAGIAAIMAVPMAWAVSRTDMPGKGFTWAVVLGAFVMVIRCFRA